jgi:hypothetical protein
MIVPTKRQRRCAVARWVVGLLVLGASATLGQGFYYKEIHKDGRIYVFNNAENAARFEQSGEMAGQSITRLGGGPNGETLVGDNERALQLYYFKHDISEPVPEPPPPGPPAPPPYKFSGLMFGDYYYFQEDHLPTFEDQHGLWFRRMYFTFDYTFSPKLMTRFRLETNSNGKLQGGAITPFVKDAYLRWNAFGRQSFTLGIQPSLSFDYIENFWGLRHIEKTPLDLFRWDSSRDTGITLSGPINQKQTIKYAVQYGNESGSNAEVDKYKAWRAAVRYEPPAGEAGFTAELMAADFNRPRDADRITEQIFVGYRGKTWGRVGAQYSYQEREQVTGSIVPDIELDIYSAFAIWDISPKKFSVFGRWDVYDDPCGPDCPGIDYLPIDGGEPFDLYIVGFEWYIHPSVRLSPNVELVKYDDPQGMLVRPEDDQVLRLTFFWTW